MDVRPKTALVTGSSSGIGRAIALALSDNVQNVVAHCRDGGSELDEVVALLRLNADRAIGVVADLSHQDGVEALLHRIRDEDLVPNILVINASVQHRRDFSAIAVDEMAAEWRTNISSTVQIIQAFLPVMMDQGWGRIVAIGSVQEVRPHPQLATYAASKAAQANLVLNLAKQAAHRGVTVNVVAPGVIETARNAVALSDPAYREQVMRSVPAGFLGQPEDVADACRYLCSPEARYVTGATIRVDGGFAL